MTRQFLDEILEFIDTESLTDEEWDSIDLEGTDAYTKEVYLALKTVLENREDVSGKTKRLKLFFIAKGVNLSDSPAIHPARSNILIGTAL